MKKQNRVRVKSNPAAQAAQLKTGLRHGEFARGSSIEPYLSRYETEPEQCDREMAEIMIYQFIKKQFDEKWDDACSELECLFQAIKHHPQLSSVVVALNKLVESNNMLHEFSCNGDKIKNFAGNECGYAPEHWQALAWFYDYFENWRDQPFKDVIAEFWGFHGWIKDQTTFKNIAAAIDDLINADCELRAFVKTAEAR